MNRLEEIRARLENATPGPWFRGYWRGRCSIYHHHDYSSCRYDYTKETDSNYFSRFVSAEGGDEIVGSADDEPVLSENDAEFIAAAPTDIKWCLETIEKLAKALKDADDEEDGATRSDIIYRALAALKGETNNQRKEEKK